MQAKQTVLLLPLFLTLPVAAHAVPIPGTGILVEYEGTITEVRDRPEYTVGDPISGRLFIDLRVRHFRQINGGTIGTIYESGDPAFVSGFWPSTGDGFDSVSLFNEVSLPGGSGAFDRFGIEDLLVGHLAPLDNAMTFSLNANLREFLTSEELDELSFELTSADVDEPGESMSGGIRWSNFGPAAFVHFVVDRLKATKPGRCVP
jgi:hypothetical protein